MVRQIVIESEPPGGAQEDWDAAAEIVRTHIRSGLRDLHGMDRDEIVQHRYAKFRRMGNFFA